MRCRTSKSVKQPVGGKRRDPCDSRGIVDAEVADGQPSTEFLSDDLDHRRKILLALGIKPSQIVCHALIVAELSARTGSTTRQNCHSALVVLHCDHACARRPEGAI